MKKKFFGTDGIRGSADKFPIIPSFLFYLAVSLTKVKKKKLKKILIGRDTRLSGKNIENSLISGFHSLGVKCNCMGVVSTPMVSFYTKLLKYDYGIMISASHNSYEDNGVKIFKKNGEKLNDNEEIKIESYINKIYKERTIPKVQSQPFSIDFSDYKNFLLKKFSFLNNLNFKIVLDCANGSLYKFAPKFFDEMGAKTFVYGCNPNGKNINKNCGALKPEKLSRLTKKFKADIGFSFDGDADRVVVSDEKGKILDGDAILATISTYLLKKKKLPKNSVISTLMSNLAFRDFLIKSGIKLFLSNVGDRYVVEEMKKKKAFIGGEQSGHIIFSDNGYSGDGILTALFILDIAVNEKCKISELANGFFKKAPQKLVNLKLKKESSEILKNKKLLNLKNRLLKFNKDCDILIRKSGTENLLRVMVQCHRKKTMESIVDNLVIEIKRIDSN